MRYNGWYTEGQMVVSSCKCLLIINLVSDLYFLSVYILDKFISWLLCQASYKSRTHEENTAQFNTPEAHNAVWGRCKGQTLVIKIDRKKIMPCVKADSLSPMGVGEREIGSTWRIDGSFLEELSFDLYFPLSRI